jgi:Mg/Co/Ni transporter MgtE
MRKSLLQQASVGVLLGSALSAGGFARVYITNGDLVNATAISVSLFSIVMISVVLGSSLPFALSKLGVDPANAGTSIQVVMDVLGVGARFAPALDIIFCSGALSEHEVPSMPYRRPWSTR